MKRFLAILLLVPAVLCCNKEKQKEETFEGEGYEKAAQMVKDGDEILVTNPNVEKFLTEVTYQDKDWSSTSIYDYYGGYNGKKYDENGNLDEANGKVVKSPKSDKPQDFSIRWKSNPDGGEIKFHLEDKLGWKRDQTLEAGTCYVNFTNLVPNDEYTYSVTFADGTEITKGSFKTKGHLHQVFFPNSCRNGRDLGGWETTDGKMVKYRMVYRGGRMQAETVSPISGKNEILAEGIGAQLDLRGESDVLSKPVFDGLEFCAPIIESGGSTMLEQDGGIKTKQCFEFVVNSLRNNKPVYFHCSLGRDRTGTLAIVLLGVLGVREGDISKEYELTYFAPKGYSIALSEDYTTFQNNRTKWVYQPTAKFFWDKAGSNGTFAKGVENYLLEIGVSQKDIDDFRSMMLTNK